MQSKSQSLSVRHALVILTSILIVGVAVFCLNPAHAQMTVTGHAKDGSKIMGVISKTAGEAQVTITDVALAANQQYCLVGVGHGQWFAKKVNGVWMFDTAKLACATPASGTVTVTVKSGSVKGQGRTIGYVPVSVLSDGKLARWEEYPAGSLTFEGADGNQKPIVAIYFAADGSVRMATAAEAKTIVD